MTTDDITHRHSNSAYCIIGFFTPNYRPRAEKFSANLRDYDVPHHLVAYPALSSWEGAILRKPEVLMSFIDSNPDRIHIQMDVDCIVRGSLAPLIENVGADVLMSFHKRRRMGVTATSRIIAWFPTAAAHRLAQAWWDECLIADVPCDEVCLTRAFHGFGQGVAVAPVRDGYDAAEMNGRNKHHVVVHWSARDATRPWFRIKKATKAIRRRAIELFLAGQSYEEWKYRDGCENQRLQDQGRQAGQGPTPQIREPEDRRKETPQTTL